MECCADQSRNHTLWCDIHLDICIIEHVWALPSLWTSEPGPITSAPYPQPPTPMRDHVIERARQTERMRYWVAPKWRKKKRRFPLWFFSSSSNNIALLREQSALSGIVLQIKKGREEKDRLKKITFLACPVGDCYFKSMLNGPEGSSYLIGLCYVMDSCLWLLEGVNWRETFPKKRGRGVLCRNCWCCRSNWICIVFHGWLFWHAAPSLHTPLPPETQPRDVYCMCGSLKSIMLVTAVTQDSERIKAEASGGT